METGKKFDLEDRLVAFAIKISTLIESLPTTISARNIAGQLIRSGTAPALNYGEAKGAESSNDFIHKMKIALKELRESYIALKILSQINIQEQDNLIDSCLVECNELISIFVKSIQTAERNRKPK
ncbi:MAG: four helix bundle protein [Bacteroidales bacterium]|jgi:four helix bundle protein